MITKYTYDAAGRMVKEGTKSYRYGYLDKVMSMTEGKNRITYGYHVDGQLATVTKGKTTEEFTWDGLALVKRGAVSYLNEPHPGGGAPAASSDGGVMFNDILGTTLGNVCADGYSPIAKTAFGDAETADNATFFTGKPHVDGLGHAFLLRNYRADLGKWPTADPLGYPDGWNQMAYGNNAIVDGFDRTGGTFWDDVLAFGIAFNDYVAAVRSEIGYGSGSNGNILAPSRSWRNRSSVGDHLISCWDKIVNTLEWVVEESHDIATGAYNIWFNESTNHVMGLTSLNSNESYNAFAQWFLTDQSPFLNFTEDYIPNMHRTSQIHDAWVDFLVSNGWSKATINVPTMVPAYMTALMVNLKETGKSLTEVIKEWAE